ncbi:hypothetical protein B566_EDAN007712 [Ephemera danica]|nr:hypothetical protein B566_EDAN007712 [Ephemera danica]
MVLSVTSMLLLSVMVLKVTGQGCAPYSQYPQHTMCIYTEKACPQKKLIYSGGLTTIEKNEVVSAHNKLRNSIVNGQVRGAPAAVAMANMVWDQELANIAQRLADQCKMAHDTQRRVARFPVGQNLYMEGTSASGNTNINMTKVTDAWFNEIYNPGFPASYINPFKFIYGAGHYTQVAWADTKTIGCGYTMFQEGSWYWKLVACNYGPAGNVIGGRMYQVK